MARRGWLKSHAATVVVFAVILAWPLVNNGSYFLTSMVTAGMLAILALGVNLVMGQAGLLTFANPAFAGIGGYTTAILSRDYGWPTLLAAVAGIVLAGFVALVVGKAVLRFRLYFLALATMGLASIFTALIYNTGSVTGGTVGMAGLPYLNVFGLTFSKFIHQYYLVWIIVLAVLVFSLAAMRSRVGRALRALASNEVAAQTLGIRTSAWKLRVFVATALISGLAGALWSSLIVAIGPNNFSLSVAIVLLIMVLIGGQSSLLGTVIGAVFITWLGLWISDFQAYSSGIYSLVLLLLVLFLPVGLVGIFTPSRLAGVGRVLGEHLKIADWRSRLKVSSEFERAAPTGVSPSFSRAGDREAGHDLPESTVEQPRSVSASSVTAASTKFDQPKGGGRLDNLSESNSHPLLMIEDVTVTFGGLRAVSDVSFDVPRGSVTALIGPNGAGKTTLFNVLSGLQRPSGGQVHFAGRNITHERPDTIARLGIARTFQNLRVFENMSVLENVMVGRHKHESSHFLAAGLRIPSQRREERQSLEVAMALLERMGVARLADLPVTSLPYGQQRLVEIARALAAEPSLLLLDEPAAGMNTHEREVLVDKIVGINRDGIDVLIVEHDMELVMGMCDFVTCLDHGSLICKGPPSEVQQDANVIRAYLGTRDRTVRAAERARERETADAPGPSRPALLQVDSVSTYYGSIGAVRNASVHVEDGEIVAILGANGAGKTTLMHTICGVLHPSEGRVLFEGRDISRMQSAEIAKLGVALVPEGRHVFPTLSVLENLELGAGKAYKGSVFRSRLESVYSLFPVLEERTKQAAGSLSGGEQQMLAISRGLMRGPQVLLVDEPSMGLAPQLVEAIFEALEELNRGGLAILMVEQNTEAALSIAHRAVVMVTGRVALSGTAAEVRAAPNLHELYLGTVDEA